MIQIPAQPEYFDLFWQLFYSQDIYGILGPMLLVVIGYYLAKKEKALGVLWFVVECLFIAQYADLAPTTPIFYWNIIILILGVVMVWLPILIKDY